MFKDVDKQLQFLKVKQLSDRIFVRKPSCKTGLRRSFSNYFFQAKLFWLLCIKR